MIRLDTTTRKLQLQLAGAVATLQLPCLVSYSDKTATTYNGGTQVSNSNSATLVDICAAPAASTIRDIDAILIWNRDTAAATIKLILNDNGTSYQLTAITLAIGDQFVYTHGEGWNVLDATGSVKQSGTSFSGYALLASPAFTGNPTAPTPAAADNDTSIATTAFVQGEIAGKAPLASPTFTGNPLAPTPAQGDNDTSIATTAFVQAETNKHKNVIINGNFDVWQRGTSFTTGFTADRWASFNTGSSFVATRQAFVLGQTAVPGEPAYYHRTVVTSVANTGYYCGMAQRIEGVRTFAGQTATLSFWAKADTAKNIAVDVRQVFGTGGSPSANVDAVTTVALTTAWQKFTITLALASLSGPKVLGTNGDDYLGIFIWLDAGSTLNALTNTLGQQSGTFDIAQVQLEAGSVATNFEYQSYGDTFRQCQRYLPAFNATAADQIVGSLFINTAAEARLVVPFGVQTRAPITGVTVPDATKFTIIWANNQNFALAAGMFFTFGGTNACALHIPVSSATLGVGGYLRSNAAGAQILFNGAEL